MREYDVSVEIDGVAIEPGDVVFVDYESITISGSDIVDGVIERGVEEMATEDDVHADIRDEKSVFDVLDECDILARPKQ